MIAGLLVLLAMPAAARAAALSVTPGLPERGARVTVAASGLEAGSRGVAQLAGARTRRFRVDARGRATIRLHLRRAIRTGSRRLRVRAGARSVTTSITVVRRRGTPSRLAALSDGRRVLLRPTSGRPGDRIDLRISGHPRRATLDVRLGDSALARRRTSIRGALTVRAATPAVAAGRRTITVSARRRSLALPYTVLSAASQPQGPPGTPPVPPPAPSGEAAVLVGAGDIADCNNPGDEATAALLDQIPGTVFTTGDNVYPTATLSQLNNCYSSSWGRHKERTRPVLGNHEYDSAGNTGHFSYFGANAGPAGKGYYSYDLGGWHVVVLNSNCAFVGGCHAGSAQEQWLRADLAASAANCTVAMMHHPRFSSGSSHGSNTAMAPFWQALYDAGAELVLAGHEHSYERFTPMTPAGVVDHSFGLRSFVIGTGGFSHYPLGTPLPTSDARNADTFGVVKFTLRDGSYDWQFVPVAGKTYTDLGSGTCHGRPARTLERAIARAATASADPAPRGARAAASAARRSAALSVSPGLPARGRRVTITASGFTPKTRGTARLAGARTRAFRVNSRGRATIRLHLRRAARTGSHRLRVRAAGKSVTTTLTIVSRRGAAPSRLAALSNGRRALLRPTSGRAGEPLRLRISGHPRRSMLNVRLAATTLARRRASSRGALTLRAATPPVAPGAHRITIASGRSKISLPYRVRATPPAPPGPPAIAPPPPAPDPVVAAAGDIACSPNDPDFAGGVGTSAVCRQRATSDLLVDAGLSAVLALGDIQYDCARLADFAGSFGTTWGRVQSIIRPTPGNHEYLSSNPDAYGASGCTSGAQGYFSYFGAAAGDPARGYYSFDLGSWHIVSLNTNLADANSCPIVSCAAGSEQEQWLRADLAAHPTSCTLAFFHHPLFTSKTRSYASRPLWDALYGAGVDVVLNGHVHNYERFAPQRPDGTADPARGIRQFVVGTGGKSLEDTGTAAPNSEARGSAYGVLALTLRAGGYDWGFRPIAGATFADAGSSACH